MPSHAKIPRFDLIHTNVFYVYPELRQLRTAIKQGDWPAVVAYFANRPVEEDPGLAVNSVGEIPRSQRFLQRMVDTQRSPLARTLLGARLIRIGWAVRSARQAQFVNRARFAAFHDYLARAERVLADATAEEPGNVGAWTQRLKTCRGLELGIDEAHRRYAVVAKLHPSPFYAQSQMVQQLCPKWGGSFELVHGFTQECLAAAPRGALTGAIVAQGYLEQIFAQGTHRHVGQKAIGEVAVAAAQSVLHPETRPVPGWVSAHGSFAAAWIALKDPARAAPHLAAMGNLASVYPWQMLGGQIAVRMARRKARRAIFRAGDTQR